MKPTSRCHHRTDCRSWCTWCTCHHHSSNQAGSLRHGHTLQKIQKLQKFKYWNSQIEIQILRFKKRKKNVAITFLEYHRTHIYPQTLKQHIKVQSSKNQKKKKESSKFKFENSKTKAFPKDTHQSWSTLLHDTTAGLTAVAESETLPWDCERKK